MTVAKMDFAEAYLRDENSQNARICKCKTVVALAPSCHTRDYVFVGQDRVAVGAAPFWQRS